MLRVNRQSFTTILLLAATAALGAKPETPHWIPLDSLNIATFLPAPPAAETPEARADLDTVLRTQKNASDAEKARAQSEKKLTLAAFTPVVGPWFTPENLPQTAAIFKQLETDSKFFTVNGKEFFKRPRPCDADATHITDITKEEEKEFSYPSGHSTRGTLFAALLSELMPELKDKLVARSQEIGWNRVIAGVHYPSDIIAGRVLGQALAKSLLANPAFKPELEKIRLELAAAKSKSTALTPAGSAP